MAINSQTLKKLLSILSKGGGAKGGAKGGGKSGMGSLLAAGGAGGSSASPPPVEGSAKPKSSASEMFSRLRSTPEGEGAELAPEAPPPPKPKKKQRSFGEYAAASFNYARGGLEALDDPEGKMIEAGRKRKGFLGGAQATAGYGVKALQNQSELGGIGDLMGGGAEATKDIPGVGKPISAFLKLGETVVKSVDKLKKWNEQIHEGNLRFSEFSASMAAVGARQLVRDIELSRERGERRAGTAELQAQQKHRMNKELSIFEDTWGQVKNLTSAGISSGVAGIVKFGKQVTGLGKVLDTLNTGMTGLANRFTGDTKAKMGLGGWMGAVGEQAEREGLASFGRPRRF